MQTQQEQTQTNPEAGAATGAAAPEQVSLGTALRELRDAVISGGAKVIESGKSLVVQKTSELGASVMAKLSEGLTVLGSDPSQRTAALEEIIKIAPIIGSTTQYASAWRKYHHGSAMNDQEMMKEGRRECLFSILSAGADLGTLGIAAAARSGVRIAIKGLSAIHVLSNFSGVKDQWIKPVLDEALENKTVLKLVDNLLNTVKPNPELNNGGGI